MYPPSLSRRIEPFGSRAAEIRRFFALFASFQEYVEFFLLDDLWDSQTSQIRFLHRFNDFSTPAVPKTPGDLIDYLQANNEFIEARNRRIAQSLE